MTATIVVNERGHLHVEGIRHTCDMLSTKMCPACQALVEYWESFIEEDAHALDDAEAFEAWLDRVAS